MKMALRTKDTELWLVKGGTTIVKVGCPTGITGLGGSKPQIDTTCLDSEEAEFIPGLAQPGAVSVEIDFNPANLSHRDLQELDESGDTVQWIIGLSDGAKNIVPTINSAGVVTFPTTRTFIDFQGYIADLPLNIALNGKVTGSMSIQRSGARGFHFKTIV
jgi:hypothetical protein